MAEENLKKFSNFRTKEYKVKIGPEVFLFEVGYHNTNHIILQSCFNYVSFFDG